MENKRKKTIILVSIIIVLIIAIIGCILIFTKADSKKNPTNNPNQSEENNKPNDNDQDNSNNNSNNNNSNDNTNNDNNENNNNPSDPGNNNSNNGNQGGSTQAPKKLRIYSCRRSVEENGIEIADSLNLTYHIDNGLQSDEVIVTIRAINGTGSSNLASMIDFYKNWFNQLNAQKGITVTTTQSGDKTVFRIKTDYTKVDYSNINFEDENRLQLYNDIRANDSLDVITEFLSEAGYTCQQPREA